MDSEIVLDGCQWVLLCKRMPSVCRFPMTAQGWPSVCPTTMCPTLLQITPESTAGTGRLRHGINWVGLGTVTMGLGLATVCPFPVTGAAWPSVALVRPTLTTQVTPESTNGRALRGNKWVLISKVRMPTIRVASVCRFPMTAAAWPSVHPTIGVALVAPMSTNGRALRGSYWVLSMVIAPFARKVAAVCRFPMTALAWPSVRPASACWHPGWHTMTTAMLVAPECTRLRLKIVW